MRFGRSAIQSNVIALSYCTSADEWDLSRFGQLDCPVFARSADQTVSSHGFDHRPVLPEECRGVVGRLHFDAASLSSALVRYLKVECVGYRLIVFIGRPAFAAHLVSPFVRRTGTL